MRCIIYIFFTLTAFTACGQPAETIKLTAEKDSCYNLTAPRHRKLEIVENTLEDTINLGGAVLYPGYTGSFSYLMTRENGETSRLHPGDPSFTWPKTSELCLFLYLHRKTRGHVIIELK